MFSFIVPQTADSLENACKHLLKVVGDAKRQKIIKNESRDDLIRYAFLIHTKIPGNSTELSKLGCKLGKLCAEKKSSSKTATKDGEKTFEKRCRLMEDCVNEIIVKFLDMNVNIESDVSSSSSSESDTEDAQDNSPVTDSGNITSDAVLHEAVNTIAIMVAGGRSAGHSYVESFVKYASDRKRKSTLIEETNKVIQHIGETLPVSLYKNTLDLTIDMLKGVNIGKKDTILESITRCRCATLDGMNNFTDLIETCSLSNEENKQRLFGLIMNPENQLNTSGCWGRELALEGYRIAISTKGTTNGAEYNGFLRHSASTLLRRGYGKPTVAELHEFLMKIFKSDKKSVAVENEDGVSEA
jgi:hypothetical protein